MMTKQKIVVILIAVLILFVGVQNLSRLVPEKKNYEVYTLALNEYNNNQYSDSYHAFGKVSRFSKLKPAAIYRQALSADKLGNTKSEMNKYKEIIRNYPNSAMSIRAKYLEAQLLYEDGNYRKAKSEFKKILDKYPKTDYAVAAKYYLGSIEVDKASKTRNEKKKMKAKKKAALYFKGYLKDAPTGRFSSKCVKKLLALNIKLNNEDYLLIVKAFQQNDDYANAQKYLRFTNLGMSWPYFVQNAYNMKNYSKVKYYTEQGLKGNGSDEILINENFDEKTEDENIYKAIDKYLNVSNDPKTSISYLLSISKNQKGYEYLLYKSCNNLPSKEQPACFNTLFYKYPEGQFAAEALTNLFYSKVKAQKYFMAKKLGKLHLSKFGKSNSAPAVMFWLAKIAERTKNYEEARGYYRKVMKEFPDSYYAYRAFLGLNRLRPINVIGLKQKAVEFPYKNSGYGLITELAKVKDYGLINQLSKDDEFIQSWLNYLQGNYATSACLARDAMDKLQEKPARDDLRWRLVYPVHYYDVIKQSANTWSNDPILILSIIREESYFNPRVQSAVGAKGLMQLMPSTASEASKISGISIPNQTLLLDPDINIRLGNVYYAKLKKTLLGKDILAVLAYNGGIGSVSSWKENLNYFDADDFVEQIPYPETKNYLKKVFKSYWNYLRTYDGVNF